MSHTMHHRTPNQNRLGKQYRATGRNSARVHNALRNDADTLFSTEPMRARRTR